MAGVNKARAARIAAGPARKPKGAENALRVPVHKNAIIPVNVFCLMYNSLNGLQQIKLAKLLGQSKIDAYFLSAADMKWNEAFLRRKRNANKK